MAKVNKFPKTAFGGGIKTKSAAGTGQKMSKGGKKKSNPNSFPSSAFGDKS